MAMASGGRSEFSTCFMFVVAALTLVAAESSALEIRRQAFSGGAVDVAGGSFRLKATVGEAGPVGNVVVGGSYRLGEGFWPGYGAISAVGVEPRVAESAPLFDALEQNSPNPFRGSTSIAFAIARGSFVKLSIYDVSGRRVTQVMADNYAPGRYDVGWAGRDDSGNPVAVGIYFYRLEIGSWSQTRKMLKLE